MKQQHKHDFVETYVGPLAHGLDRESDLATLTVYLQKLSDDDLTATLLPRLTQDEVDGLFDLVAKTLRRHLNEEEYHRLFLKEEPEGSSR